MRGRKVQKSTGETSIAKARKFYENEIQHAKRAGRLAGLEESVTYGDIRELIVQDYKQHGKLLKTLEDSRLPHLDKYFANRRVVDIGAAMVAKYKAMRLTEEGSSLATVNRELAALRRMLNLAVDQGMISKATPPKISTPSESNARKGFFEREPFESVVKHLPAEIQPIVRVAYISGWRVTSELLTRKKHHVDLDAGWLRLDPGETKNGEGRNFPLTGELRVVLEQVLADTRKFELEHGCVLPWLFNRNGKQVKFFRRSWMSACKKAGYPGRLLHDFRRTAVRNLERPGISRGAAMKMVGHKTVSIYNRYAIADEQVLKEAAGKLDDFNNGRAQFGRSDNDRIQKAE